MAACGKFGIGVLAAVDWWLWEKSWCVGFEEAILQWVSKCENTWCSGF